MPDNNSQNSEHYSQIPEDKSKLGIIKAKDPDFDVSLIIAALKKDKVILLQGIAPEKADEIIAQVAGQFGLAQALEVQAAFASIKGLRENVGKNFMTVNKRDDFQVIPPHSEGMRPLNMQLTSFYCYQNTIDGGETILLNTNDEASGWQGLKELVNKIDIGVICITDKVRLCEVRTTI